MNIVQATATLFLLFSLPCMNGQEKKALDADDPAAKNEDKRVLGVLPNYRTAEMTPDYHPISNKYKLKIALKDTFDYPLIGVGAAYALLYQAEDSHPQFGQGVEGYAKRFGTAYTDQVVGNMLTEGILPILFKEDPRYFRKSQGSVRSRLGYAFSRIVITRTNTGANTFNFAEIVGNGIAAGVGLSYYQDDRDVHDVLQNWGTQLATDAISQVLKEFWPDIKRKYFHKHAHVSAN
jgi:hypothetical protein